MDNQNENETASEEEGMEIEIEMGAKLNRVHPDGRKKKWGTKKKNGNAKR